MNSGPGCGAPEGEARTKTLTTLCTQASRTKWRQGARWEGCSRCARALGAARLASSEDKGFGPNFGDIGSARFSLKARASMSCLRRGTERYWRHLRLTREPAREPKCMREGTCAAESHSDDWEGC
ncbi:MAG: hypothetical protein EOO71_11680 [Myxococcaceae bacterium]|nr:MAG: hypothetical protein EOO71_11680 [Myxococcaceae bacterium]